MISRKKARRNKAENLATPRKKNYLTENLFLLPVEIMHNVLALRLKGKIFTESKTFQVCRLEKVHRLNQFSDQLISIAVPVTHFTFDIEHSHLSLKQPDSSHKADNVMIITIARL